MLKDGHWRNFELRKHVKVVEGKLAPTLVLKNATHLNMYIKQWITANIWIYNERIVYVGNNLPQMETEIVDCTGKYIVPGYIEPHAHPFQLYNPEMLAKHAAKFGTTTLVNDNLSWLFLLDKKKAFSILADFEKIPIVMYWWSRFDPQTEITNEEEIFNTEDMLDWLSHPCVIQGGELTGWPNLLNGDDRLLYWIQEAKRKGKPIEGHLPGASENTLTKLKLLGVSADHESISGEDVLKRLTLGYQVGLRYSSIRPDLPKLIEEIIELGLTNFDQLTMTTDGGTPGFYEQGLMNVCIEIAIEKGVPVEEAYRMATFNVAKHFHLEEQLGCIAPGRMANINILTAKDNPHPESVIAKGKWIVKNTITEKLPTYINWKKYDIETIDFDWEMSLSDLQFSIPIGLEMQNDVIIKPYAIQTDITVDNLPEERDDAFLLLLDKYGKWRVNTTIRGFTKKLGGLVSSFSQTGDLVFIGKNKDDMLLAWQRLKEIGGGIVLVHEGEVIAELPLQLAGKMYSGNMEELIEKEKLIKEKLLEFGYQFNDPIYCILFLSSTHLPYIRITQEGVIDVKKRELLFPATMR
ncbi:adenine deaminase C-terminal domain-containing protein [Ornithinibacillus halotolerans]|uniref:adenine deaminase n=1 Tax=Ornithinibacillus halotolerans TaxID=1274357 RepID=A0A916RXH1_9BACI|nr:adenine deaminase C-terminal domain-containing protein [Ornithinibacillus halotolerans]GGA75618.1 putative adenine deaminase [Ornithinibacillus halotolerans]